MTGSKPTPPQEPPDGPADDEPDAVSSPKSGRVTFDSRGNAVWEWSMATGAFGREVDTKRLEKLEAEDLKIIDDPAKPATRDPAAPKGERGSDPYNTAAASVSPRGSSTPGKPMPAKPTDLRKLSEWIKQQKALGRKVGKE
jgi:hypothetical protein